MNPLEDAKYIIFIVKITFFLTAIFVDFEESFSLTLEIFVDVEETFFLTSTEIFVDAEETFFLTLT